MTKTYPAVTFIAQHGRRLAVTLAVVLLLATIGLWLMTSNPVGLLIGVPVAITLWAVVRVASEVIEVVAETLLPR
jgi:predicted PurR-regulated permease PerM